MTTNIIYRKLTETDIPMYHLLRLECLKNYPDNFGTLYEEEILNTQFKVDKFIDQQHKTNFLMGAFDNETLIGTCGFIQEQRIKTMHVGDISHMYITPAYSSKGIAGLLLQATINIIFQNKAIELISLAVAATNSTALHLYAKYGFVEYGKLENCFKHNGEYTTQVFMSLKRIKE